VSFKDEPHLPQNFAMTYLLVAVDPITDSGAENPGAAYLFVSRITGLQNRVPGSTCGPHFVQLAMDSLSCTAIRYLVFVVEQIRAVRKIDDAAPWRNRLGVKQAEECVND
jgi:hypothetical protein